MRETDLEKFRMNYPASCDPEVEFSKVLEVATPEVDNLYSEIFNDLDDTKFGVGWWAPYPGTSRRILVSHYLVECLKSITTNLTEAALHLLEAIDHWEKESDFLADTLFRDKDGKLSMNVRQRKAAIDDLSRRLATLHAVGFFRALVGALDCFGASIVGVLGLPIDIRRASLNGARGALSTTSLAIQTDFRQKLDELVTDAGPTGWLDWIVDYRNMVVHRGRRWHVHQFLPRDVRLYGADGRIIPRVIVIEHLPSDPSRSQIEAFVDNARAPVLAEHGEATMRGALKSSLKLTRSVAVELIQVWKIRRETPDLLPQPSRNWPNGLSTQSTEFYGYRPDVPYDPSMWGTHRDIARQFRTAALADDLRPRWRSFD